MFTFVLHCTSMDHVHSPEHPQSPQSAETKAALQSELLAFVDNELQRMDKVMTPLLELRHDLFDVNQTEYTKELPIADQLYEDTSNNIGFISHDMGLRQGNALAYHQTTEKYDRGYSEEHAERDFVYRQAILAGAQELGFVAKQPGVASDPLDQHIGILDSNLEPIDEKVAAIVINGAAGMSNVKRIRDAIRNIESGAVNTDRIIMAAGTREVNDAEKSRLKPPFHPGNSEFELMKLGTQDLLGVSFDDEPTVIDVEYGNNFTATVEKTVAMIGGRAVTIEIIEAPYDSERIMDNGKNADRINTEETFLATLPLLEGEKGAIVMESHDTWVNWQNLIGHQVFGLKQGRNVYPAGPLNAERVYWSEEDGQKTMDIDKPQDVVDEMVKTYKQLVSLRTSLQN